MAPSGKKSTFVAPGKIGSYRGQGLKATFLPGGLYKASSSASSDKVFSSKTSNATDKLCRAALSKENEFPNVEGSNTNGGSSIDATIEEANPLENSVQPTNEDIYTNDQEERTIINNEEVPTTTMTRKRTRKPDAKPRGVNKCKKVANLKEGQKLEVELYNNGPVGENHTDLTRHMGRLVRDRTICPVRVHTWDEIEDSAKEHMWQSVLNKFTGKGYSLDRKTTIEHMRRLWHNWRGILNRDSIIKKGGPENALKELPNDLTQEDWEWLVKEHFTSEAFKKVSSRNSSNRENLKMPHRTGSKPFRQIIWEDMGGKEGNTPPISAVFKRTRKGKSGSLAQAEAAKYDEIIAVEQDNPSLSHFEVVQKCFGEQDRGSVVCFGFGVRPKDVRGPLPSRSELTASLHEKQRENDDLRKRMDEMDKTRQEEREADRTKISALEEKFDILMRAYLQRSNGGDQLNSNIN